MIHVCLVGDQENYLTQMDAKCLKNYFEVTTVDVSPDHPLRLAKASLTSLRKATRDSDLVLVHGADVHAAVTIKIAHINDNRTILAVHGNEVINLPEFGYGLQINKFHGGMARWALKNTDHVIAYTFSNWAKIEEFTNRPVHKLDGYVNPYKEEGQITALTKKDFVLTVADATPDTYRVSGLQMFNMLAISQPMFPFYVIGKTDDTIMKMYDRVKYLGDLDHDKTVDFISKAKFYCQFSYIDNFNPYAIAALQMGCSVIYVNNDGLRDTIGQDGFPCKFMDVYDAGRQLLVSAKSYDVYRDSRNLSANRCRNDYSMATYSEALRKELTEIYEEV